MTIVWCPELAIYKLTDGEHSRAISESELQGKYAQLRPLFLDAKRQYELTEQGITV